MDLITSESLDRPEVRRWHQRILTRYTPPEGTALTIFLPCSARKPYSMSRSHRMFHEHIRGGAKRLMARVHQVILTSPLGFVPRELEGVYPAAHYDVPVTGRWTEYERDIVVRLVSDYLEKAGWPVLAHVDGDLREVCSGMDIPLTPERCLSDDSLMALKKAIRDRLHDVPKIKRDPLGPLRKVADFQFGLGGGELLLPEGSAVRRYRIFLDGKQTASISPRDGLFSLGLHGGELLLALDRYQVDISFEARSSSILAPGVDRADPAIRPGDEVMVVRDGELVGVGRASMAGEEMERATRGLAVDLRHRA